MTKMLRNAGLAMLLALAAPIAQAQPIPANTAPTRRVSSNENGTRRGPA